MASSVLPSPVCMEPQRPSLGTKTAHAHSTRANFTARQGFPFFWFGFAFSAFAMALTSRILWDEKWRVPAYRTTSVTIPSKLRAPKGPTQVPVTYCEDGRYCLVWWYRNEVRPDQTWTHDLLLHHHRDLVSDVCLLLHPLIVKAARHQLGAIDFSFFLKCNHVLVLIMTKLHLVTRHCATCLLCSRTRLPGPSFPLSTSAFFWFQVDMAWDIIEVVDDILNGEPKAIILAEFDWSLADSRERVMRSVCLPLQIRTPQPLF